MQTIFLIHSLKDNLQKAKRCSENLNIQDVMMPTAMRYLKVYRILVKSLNLYKPLVYLIAITRRCSRNLITDLCKESHDLPQQFHCLFSKTLTSALFCWHKCKANIMTSLHEYWSYSNDSCHSVKKHAGMKKSRSLKNGLLNIYAFLLFFVLEHYLPK